MDTVRLNTKLISSLSNVLFIPAAEIINATSIANSTWYRITQTPVIISIQQLLAIANGLHIPARRFFSTDMADYIGRRDDYITEPYLPCHYDEAALQELVTSRPGTTWAKAAKATGMSYSRLRDSLLAVTRTPVVRFLAVCASFEIDPFSILIDPNPEPKKGKRGVTPANTSGWVKEAEALRTEIGRLYEDVSSLSATVDELTRKYDALLRVHEMLARRLSVNIENVNSSYIGIAAEPLPDKGK